MALDSYTNLQAAVASWIGRTDLSSNIPDFITLFETEANTRLRVRQMEGISTLTSTGGRASLPEDYLAWRRLTWRGNTGVDMQYLTPSGLRIQFPTFVAGIPTHFSIEPPVTITADEDDITVDDDDFIGTFQLVTADTDDTPGAFQFEYYKKIPPLSAGLNWLLVDYPNLYLYGTLTEAYGFQTDAENMALWGSRRDDVFDKIMRLDVKTRGPSRIMVAGATP